VRPRNPELEAFRPREAYDRSKEMLCKGSYDLGNKAYRTSLEDRLRRSLGSRWHLFDRQAARCNRFKIGACALGCLVALPAFAEAPTGEVEMMGTGQLLGIAFFLLIAALVVVSTICKLLLAFGLVPGRRKSRVRRVIVWLARAAGDVRVADGSRDRRSSTSSYRGGGGSSGGGGASGEF
jgi:hypothetical protein